jgi:cytochrome c oxidase subunit I
VRGPHELSDPEMERKLGRDWVGQAEVVASEEPGAMRTAARGMT